MFSLFWCIKVTSLNDWHSIYFYYSERGRYLFLNLKMQSLVGAVDDSVRLFVGFVSMWLMQFLCSLMKITYNLAAQILLWEYSDICMSTSVWQTSKTKLLSCYASIACYCNIINIVAVFLFERWFTDAWDKFSFQTLAKRILECVWKSRNSWGKKSVSDRVNSFGNAIRNSNSLP